MALMESPVGLGLTETETPEDAYLLSDAAAVPSLVETSVSVLRARECERDLAPSF